MAKGAIQAKKKKARSDSKKAYALKQLKESKSKVPYGSKDRGLSKKILDGA